MPAIPPKCAAFLMLTSVAACGSPAVKPGELRKQAALVAWIARDATLLEERERAGGVTSRFGDGHRTALAQAARQVSRKLSRSPADPAQAGELASLRASAESLAINLVPRTRR